MSKCPGCGVELLDGTTFCPYCGARVNSVNNEEQSLQDEVILPDNQQPVNEGPKEKKVFKVFATLGQIFGIITLVCIFLTIVLLGVPEIGYMIAILSVEISVPTFVFGILGKKSLTARGKGKFAFVVGLIGTIVLFILVIVLAVLIALNEVSSGGGGYIYY